MSPVINEEWTVKIAANGETPVVFDVADSHKYDPTRARFEVVTERYLVPSTTSALNRTEITVTVPLSDQVVRMMHREPWLEVLCDGKQRWKADVVKWTFDSRMGSVEFAGFAAP